MMQNESKADEILSKTIIQSSLSKKIIEEILDSVNFPKNIAHIHHTHKIGNRKRMQIFD